MEPGEPRSDVLLGEMVDGRYRLVEQIGEGVTGTVYRAVAEPGSVAVAVKILRPDLAPGASAQAARRFEREAVAAGKVSHANLVGVRDFGALEDGRPYLVMDLVEGRSLAGVIAEESPLAPARALAILAHVLRGLRQAHEGGVVHRDLKPADIVLVERGEERELAVIVDFGTAALLGGSGAAAEQLTRAGIALGEPAYIAPERLDGEAPVDGRADLYSATCILFEMLSGQPPFGAAGAVDTAELFARHRAAPRPQLGDVAPELASPALDAIVARGLAVDPGERFASADDYLAAVKAFLEGERDPSMVAARPPRPPGQLAEPDPSNATTVFHGAPPPDALLAVAAPMPVASPEPVAVERGGRVRVWRAAATAGGVGALVVISILLGRVGGEEPGAGVRAPRVARAPARDPMAGLIEAWRAAGLEPGRFAAVDGDAFGGGDCRRGGVSGIDVVVCRHATAAEAMAARDRALAAKARGARAAIASDDRLLVAQRQRRRDPRRTLTAVTRAFRSATAPRGDKVRAERTE